MKGWLHTTQNSRTWASSSSVLLRTRFFEGASYLSPGVMSVYYNPYRQGWQKLRFYWINKRFLKMTIKTKYFFRCEKRSHYVWFHLNCLLTFLFFLFFQETIGFLSKLKYIDVHQNKLKCLPGKGICFQSYGVKLFTGWNDKIVVLKKTTLQLYFKTFIEKINSGNFIM